MTRRLDPAVKLYRDEKRTHRPLVEPMTDAQLADAREQLLGWNEKKRGSRGNTMSRRRKAAVVPPEGPERHE